MMYVVLLNFFVYLLIIFDKSNTVLFKLTLIPDLVLKGEVWRLLTFIFIPPTMSPFWIIITLYFYYLAGRGLEQEWGSFKLNIYYLFGMLATIISSFIIGGPANATYINLSLFLAFARIYPDYEILLFFVIPVKVKYIAYVNWFIIIYGVVSQPLWSYKIAAVVAVINYFIFFGRDIVTNGVRRQKVYNRRRKFKSEIPYKDYIHKCVICGVTEKDDPNMEFRYCSKCNGYYEYCMKHINNHEHK
nr:derlin [Clostridium simiarum]